MGMTPARINRSRCCGTPGVSRTLVLTSDKQPDRQLAKTHTAVILLLQRPIL